MRYRVLALPIFLSLCLLIGLELVSSSPASASAAVFVVNSTADAIDQNPGDGVCETSGGECTLRAAIHEANNLPGADTINLPAGEYIFTLAGSGENDSLTGDLDIWEDLTITGESYTTTIINANELDRVFQLFSGLVTISDVTISNGRVVDGFYGAAITQAGSNQLILTHSRVTNSLGVGDSAIHSTGQLTLTYSLIDHNEGNGIFVIHDPWASPYFTDYMMGNTITEQGGTGLILYTAWETTATIVNNTFSFNDNGGAYIVSYGPIVFDQNQVINNTINQDLTSNVGAGLYLGGYGMITVTNSLIAHNQILGNTSGANGGGIYASEGVGVKIFSTTFENNFAAHRGAGLYHGAYNLLTIADSLFVSNEAQEGAGLNLAYSSSPITIMNSTLSGNQLLPTGSFGAAISSEAQNLSIINSTIANHEQNALNGYGLFYFVNTILANEGTNCSENPGVLSQGYNIENQDSCRLDVNDLVNVDPRLGALQDNGGSTLTHALLPYSPAVDAGNNEVCPATDQRGVTRPINTLGTPICDIGAYEYNGPADVIAVKGETAFEAEGSLEFVVELWVPFTQTVTVDFTTVDNTAVAGADYEAISGTVTFPAGVVSQTIPVTIYNDPDPEPVETFFLELDNASVGTIVITQAVGTIILGEEPQLSISDLTLVEGSTGSYESFLYTITVSSPPAITITVDLTATSQTAIINGGDVTFFTGLPLEKVIAPGETSVTAMFWVVADSYYEADETFLFQLENATYAHIADGEATVTILNDDAPPQIEINDVSVIRDVDNNTVARFRVYINGPWNETITVDYATEDGTAQAGQEYEATSGTLIFDNPWNTYFIDVPVLAGEYDPAHTTFFLNLSNPTGAEIGDNQAVGVLLPSEIQVNSTADGIDVEHGDGVCATSAGECTLRAAVQEANAIYGENIILLPAGIYTLELAGDQEDESFIGDLDILDNLIIRGEDPETTKIDVNGFERAFHNLTSIHTSSTTSLILENLSVSGATQSAIFSYGLLILDNVHMVGNSSTTRGGAIVTQGDLRILNSLLMNNSAYQGGAIYADGYGTTIITNTIILSNTATYRSSAIEVTTPFSIYNSQISHNAIVNNNPELGGGAIVGPNLTMENSEVSYNTTYDEIPCPVFCFTPYGAITLYGQASFLENNIIAHNSAHGLVLSYGDLSMEGSFVGYNGTYGVWAYNNSSGSISFINNTFSSNSNAGVYGIGNNLAILRHNTFANNGEYGLAYYGRPEAANNIFVGNEPANCNPIVGTLLISRGGNIDSGLSCALTNANDMVNTDPMLLPLADNGGNTWTHALPAESSAVDGGQNEFCSSTDQRGEPRPMDGDGDGEAICDSGAYEREGEVAGLPEVNITETVTVTETHTGTTTITVAVALSVTSTEPVTVTYYTVTGTATPDEDYQTITNTVVFSPGETTQIITLTIYGDEVVEGNETFTVRLDQVVNGVLGHTEALVTIINDDMQPPVQHHLYLPIILR